MASVKVPYTMYCSSCKAALRIKKASMVGTFIHCPKCKRRIEIVTPEMDGNIPYGVGEAVQAPEERKLSQFEIDEMEAAALRQKKWERNERIKYFVGLFFILAFLACCGYVFYQKIYVEGYGSREPEKTKTKNVGRRGGS